MKRSSLRAAAVLLVTLLSLFVLSPSAKAEDGPPAQEFKAGQVWHYHTRPGEERSLLYIVKVDTEKDKKIYHVSLDGLKLKNSKVGGGAQATLAHTPMSEEALRKSVTTLVRDTGSMPDIKEAYAAWKKDYEAKKAYAFKIPVSDILDGIEKSLEHPQSDPTKLNPKMKFGE